jgi:magnesium chelatase family protein
MRGEGDLIPAEDRPPADTEPPPDLAEVRGQARARRALEVAAAGSHNLLLVGAPGCGKTMLAARMPGILPSLSFDEAVDLTRVYSAAGLLPPDQGLLRRRPFRAPHHSITAAGMVGTAALQPGEVSLAHHGVLFLDEIAEFRRGVLELLRGPLEDRSVRLVRAAGSAVLPADVSLVAAANPCPCGYAGHPVRACVCTPSQVDRYRGRLSGPLLDRIDLQVWVRPVDSGALVGGDAGESSAEVRARVEAARHLQRARQPDTGAASNAALSGDAIRRAAAPTANAQRALQQVLDRHALSARAWSRILKVARTIADLDRAGRVDVPHVLEATAYRLPEGEEATP